MEHHEEAPAWSKNPFEEPPVISQGRASAPVGRGSPDTPFIDSYINDFKRPNFGGGSKPDGPLNVFHTFKAQPIAGSQGTSGTQGNQGTQAWPSPSTANTNRSNNPFENFV